MTDGAPPHACPGDYHILEHFHLVRWFTEPMAQRRRFLHIACPVPRGKTTDDPAVKPAKGTNHKIKLIQRRGYGYQNFDHLRLRIRLETGNREGKYVKFMF